MLRTMDGHMDLYGVTVEFHVICQACRNNNG